MPDTLVLVNDRVLKCTRPSKPSSIPRTSHPKPTEVLTAARITAFNAGQSPPPVRIPIRMGGDIFVEAKPFLKLFEYACFIGGKSNEKNGCSGRTDLGVRGDIDDRLCSGQETA